MKNVIIGNLVFKTTVPVTPFLWLTKSSRGGVHSCGSREAVCYYFCCIGDN